MVADKRDAAGAGTPTASTSNEILDRISLGYDDKTSWVDLSRAGSRLCTTGKEKARVFTCVIWCEVYLELEFCRQRGIDSVDALEKWIFEGTMSSQERVGQLEQAALIEPDGWLNRLMSAGVPGTLSPLHYLDIDEHTKVLKKPHHHMMLVFEGNHTSAQALDIAEAVAPGHHSAHVMAPVAMASEIRYFKHKDNKDPFRYHYDAYEMLDFGGFDSSPYFEATEDELAGGTKRLMRLISERGIEEYSELLDMLATSTGLFKLATSPKVRPVIDRYITSRRCAKPQMLTAGAVKRVIYIYGAPGVGKTTLAKEKAQALVRDSKDGIYIAGASNDPLQDYKSQPVVILDDMRPEAFELSDLLRMLDPFTATSAKARYRNKDFAPAYIFITSPMPLWEWVSRVPGAQDEDISQVYRRIPVVAHVRPDCVEWSTVDLEGHLTLVVTSAHELPHEDVVDYAELAAKLADLSWG